MIKYQLIKRDDGWRVRRIEQHERDTEIFQNTHWLVMTRRADGWYTVKRYFDTSEQARAFVESANWYAQSVAETAFPKLKTTLIEPPK